MLAEVALAPPDDCLLNLACRQGYRLSAYATFWIRRSITRAIENKSRTIRLPSYLSNALGKVSRAREAFIGEHGRKPTYEELSELVGIGADRIMDAESTFLQPISLDSPADCESDLPLLAILEDRTAKPVGEKLEIEEVQLVIAECLEKLPRGPRQVVKLHFGLDGEDPLSLKAIASRFGIPFETVRRYEVKALEKMREALEESGLIP